MDQYDLVGSQGIENCLWDWDLTTNRIYYSSGWISMLGWGGVEFGNSCEEWFGRIHPEDSESVQREISAQLARGATQFEIQHRMLHQDGCYRWVVCRGMISRDSNGQPIRIRGFLLDKTNEKVADAVTGLPNRLLLLDRLALSIEKAKKHGDFLFAVLVIDLDLFESGINRLETVNADSLITAAARRLETSLRSRDVYLREGQAHLIARSSGEEFVVLLDGMKEIGEAKRVAEKLLKEILLPFDFNGREVFLSPSIGISLSATKYRQAEEALRDADTALYRAKSFGKCRCEVFDTAAMETMRNQSQLEQEIQKALNRKEFVVYYQPIVDLSRNQVAGFEALVRWNHPSRGIIPPLEFIPVAQKSGLIIGLDRQILQQACRQLKTWKDDPRVAKDLWISVNLSSNHFLQPALVKDIQTILHENDLDASSLMFELTEGTVMEDPETARELLMRLRVMGARIGLDDFGTGYSSLAYLRRFPLDYLKIDHAFVRGIETGADNLEIIRAITLLSRQLGLRVIVEGIERPGQLEVVRSLGCEYGQGFLFSRAVEARQAVRCLLEGFAEEKPEHTGITPPGLGSPVPAPIAAWKIVEKLMALPKRNLFFRALPICLLFAFGIAAFSHLRGLQRPSPPSQTDSGAVLKEPMASAFLPATAETVPQQTARVESPARTVIPSKSTVKVTGTDRKRLGEPAETTYSFPVVHDHVLGSCQGIISFNRNGISFTSEKDKDSFAYAPSECLYAIDRERLTIKAGEKVFRFKSAVAQSKDENRSQLSEIYKQLSSLYDPGPRQASQSNHK